MFWIKASFPFSKIRSEVALVKVWGSKKLNKACEIKPPPIQIDSGNSKSVCKTINIWANFLLYEFRWSGFFSKKLNLVLVFETCNLKPLRKKFTLKLAFRFVRLLNFESLARFPVGFSYLCPNLLLFFVQKIFLLLEKVTFCFSFILSKFLFYFSKSNISFPIMIYPQKIKLISNRIYLSLKNK